MACPLDTLAAGISRYADLPVGCLGKLAHVCLGQMPHPVPEGCELSSSNVEVYVSGRFGTGVAVHMENVR